MELALLVYGISVLSSAGGFLAAIMENSCSFSKATHNFYVVDSEPAEFN